MSQSFTYLLLCVDVSFSIAIAPISLLFPVYVIFCWLVNFCGIITCFELRKVIFHFCLSRYVLFTKISVLVFCFSMQVD